MKLTALILASAAFSLAATGHAEPDPPLAAETEIAPVVAVEPAPVPRIKVGGPCTYATTELTATITEVTDTGAMLMPAEGRAISFPSGDFVRTGGQPEVGQTYMVSKRSITTGTCVPFLYELVGPASIAEPEVSP